MTKYELSLTLPFYNEEKNVRKVVQDLVAELEKVGIDYELVLVNNGSTDRTGEIISLLAQDNPRLRTVTIEVNEGYGWGIINGLRENQGEYVGFSDGDGQIPPESIVQIFDKIRVDSLDICKAYRVVRDTSPIRKLVSKIFNFLFPIFFHTPIGDINGKPKIMRRNVYELLDLNSKDWFIDAEIILKAQALGYKMGEVPVKFKKRQEGASSVRFRTILEFLSNMMKFKLK